jgi:hypothetical protein
MDELKQFVIGFLAKTLNKSADEVSSLLIIKGADDKEVLNKDALSRFLDLDKSRISAIETAAKTDEKATYDKGYKKAQAETMSKFEQDIKEKYSITEDKKGLELVDAIINSKVSGAELEDEKVIRSKRYLDDLNKLKQEKEAAIKAEQKKYQDRETELVEKETFGIVSKHAFTLLDKLGALWPEEEELANNWKGIFNERISPSSGYKFEVKEDGKTIIVLKKEGDEYKTLLDEHKHPVSFEKFIEKTAGSIIKFKQGDKKEGTGNSNDESGTGDKGYKGPKPKDEAEYQKMIAEAKDEDMKIAITKSWIGK